MSFLPQEIIGEILRRLPVNSLLRFRSVSKSWRSLIDSNRFARLHLNHSLTSNSNRTFFVDSSHFYYVDLDSFKQLPLGDTQIDPYSLIACCDGLVLLSPDYGEIFLWNPSIRKLRKLPAQPPIPERFFDNKFVMSTFAMGYDSKHDDYKVVRVVQTTADGDSDSFWTETWIYSLKDDSWKKAKDFPYLLPRHTSRWGMYLNGALHTVAKNSRKSEVIMAFDLGKEEHYELPLPEYRGGDARHGPASADVLAGCLAAVVGGKKNSTEIWLMKEYGVKESWMKLLRFEPPIPDPCMDLRPLAYSKSGEEVLLSYDGMCLNWFNLRTESVTIVYVDDLTASFNTTAREPNFSVEVSVCSLVSPYSAKGKLAQKQNYRRKEVNNNKKRDDFLSTGFKLRL